MLKLPVTGYAHRVTDSVERAMEILKDRKDPASKSDEAAVTPNGSAGSSRAVRSGRRPFR